jgi:dTDP-4-amino-4,6-dideoxygalactose transaminase
MTELQAALGRAQLPKLSSWVEARRKNARLLDDGFARIGGLRLTTPPPHIGHAYYKYYALLDPSALRAGWDQLRIVEAITAEGVPCGTGSCSEIYREQAFVRAGLGPAAPLPVARRLGDASLMFMVHPTLTEQDMRDTVAAVAKVMEAAT